MAGLNGRSTLLRKPSPHHTLALNGPIHERTVMLAVGAISICRLHSPAGSNNLEHLREM